jgi:hypothetical protein
MAWRPQSSNLTRGDGARDFDLNIEKVLDGWTVSHAVREINANALDEQILSGTAPIEIGKPRPGEWRIRDFGRGLRHTHLTQNESVEKRRRESEVIGRFGVGLKDALAVLDRRGVGVVLGSAHGDISLVYSAKSGFADVGAATGSAAAALDTLPSRTCRRSTQSATLAPEP